MLEDLGPTSMAEETVPRVEEMDLKSMLEAFGRTGPIVNGVATYIDGDDDPTKMLADIDGQTLLSTDATVDSYSEDDEDDRRAMVARLDQKTSRPTRGLPRTGSEDLQTLHDRLVSTLTPEPTHTPAAEVAKVPEPEAACDLAIVPYVIACQLELAGYP